MEYILAALVGLFIAIGIYLLLSRSVIRMLIGLTIFGNGVLLLIFTAGRLTQEVSAIVPEGLEVPEGAIANPLPQALILTAIVIAFSVLAFAVVLIRRAYEVVGTDDLDQMKDTDT